MELFVKVFDFDKDVLVLVRFFLMMYLQNILSKIRPAFLKVDRQSLRQEFKHAFSIGTSSENKALNEKEQALILKLVAVIKKRKLTVPATMFLECTQPLNYIGSQMMVFFKPFLTFFFTPTEYELFQGILEKREGMKRIIEELEKSNDSSRDAGVGGQGRLDSRHQTPTPRKLS